MSNEREDMSREELRNMIEDPNYKVEEKEEKEEEKKEEEVKEEEVKEEKQEEVKEEKEEEVKDEKEEKSDDPYEKRYKDLRSRWDRTNQENAAYRKKQDELEDRLNKISAAIARADEEKNIDPIVLAEEIRTKGIQALYPIAEKLFNPEKENLDKINKALINDNWQKAIDLSVMSAKNDKENFPLFNELEPIMVKISSAKEYPVDRTKPINEQIEKLYMLALQSEEGKKIAMDTKNKSKTSVISDEERRAVSTTGSRGKSTGPSIDLGKITRDKVREMIESGDGGGDAVSNTEPGAYSVRF